MIAGATETRSSRWDKQVGDVELLPIVFNPRGNWRVAVRGQGNDRDVIEKAVELLRGEHPYVRAERGPDG